MVFRRWLLPPATEVLLVQDSSGHDLASVPVMCSGCVSVLIVTETWFTGMHLWRGDYDSFIRDAQMNYGKRLIVVPLTTFHRMAEVIGDPQGELIFVFITTRCGSTLLTQVNHLRSVDKALIVSTRKPS